MGEIADMMIEGFLDEQTGEFLDGKSPGYPRTRVPGQYNTIKNGKIKSITNELRQLIKSKQSKCTTMKERNHAVEIARQEINVKYGKGWREQF